MSLQFQGRLIEAVTFDCYGTLIDWETGILRAFERMLGPAIVLAQHDALLRAYARYEREIESGPYRRYRDVLGEVARRVAREFGVPMRPGGEAMLAESIRDWPAFDETPGALRALKARACLVVLSNIDDDLFEGSRSRLGVELDALITAEQVRSYKPGPAHFHEAMRRLRLTPERILHIAESRYHDVAPARSLDIATVWVNRHASDGGGGSASGESSAVPDLEVRSLAELVARLLTAG